MGIVENMNKKKKVKNRRCGSSSVLQWVDCVPHFSLLLFFDHGEWITSYSKANNIINIYDIEQHTIHNTLQETNHDTEEERNHDTSQETNHDRVKTTNNDT